MGYDLIELHAVSSLSRHNSPRDDAHNAAWNEFVAAVSAAAEVAAGAGIHVDVLADGELPTDRWGNEGNDEEDEHGG